MSLERSSSLIANPIQPRQEEMDSSLIIVFEYGVEGFHQE